MNENLVQSPTKRVSYSIHLCKWIRIFEFQIFIDILMDISDIELELIIFIRVKIIIHVYDFRCKKYVVTVQNRMEVVNGKPRM